MKIKYKYVLAITALLLIALYITFLKTDYLIPSRSEVQDPSGFTQCIIRELDKKLPPADTLHIVTYKLDLICGTGVEPSSLFEEKITRLKEAINEPVYIQYPSYRALYNFSGRSILTGTFNGGPEGCNCFDSKIIIPLTPEFAKKLYVINYEKLRKNNASILITDFEETNTILKFNIERSQEKWQVVQ